MTCYDLQFKKTHSPTRVNIEHRRLERQRDWKDQVTTKYLDCANWTSDVTSLYSSFLICQMGAVTAPYDG